MSAATSVTADTYQPHTLDDYPELTPEEIGRRVLNLIDSLKSFDELSLGRITEVMNLAMTPLPSKNHYFFTMHVPESDWYYGITYHDDVQYPRYKNLEYRFTNKDDRADMGPVCGLEFSTYIAALKNMGFKEDAPTHDELGRLVALYYQRNNVSIQIVERREADTPNAKLHHACVESIHVRRVGA